MGDRQDRQVELLFIACTRVKNLFGKVFIFKEKVLTVLTKSINSGT
jgi:hypothetical protein